MSSVILVGHNYPYVECLNHKPCTDYTRFSINTRNNMVLSVITILTWRGKSHVATLTCDSSDTHTQWREWRNIDELCNRMFSSSQNICMDNRNLILLIQSLLMFYLFYNIPHLKYFFFSYILIITIVMFVHQIVNDDAQWNYIHQRVNKKWL